MGTRWRTALEGGPLEKYAGSRRSLEIILSWDSALVFMAMLIYITVSFIEKLKWQRVPSGTYMISEKKIMMTLSHTLTWFQKGQNHALRDFCFHTSMEYNNCDLGVRSRLLHPFISFY